MEDDIQLSLQYADYFGCDPVQYFSTCLILSLFSSITNYLNKLEPEYSLFEISKTAEYMVKVLNSYIRHKNKEKLTSSLADLWQFSLSVLLAHVSLPKM